MGGYRSYGLPVHRAGSVGAAAQEPPQAISSLGRQSCWDSRRAAFVLADPGYDTTATLRSWRAAHGRRWEAVGDRAGRHGGEVPPFVSPAGLNQSRIESVRYRIHHTAELMPVPPYRGAAGGQWPLWHRGPPAALLRGPVNGVPGVFAGVLRHRVSGGRRLLSDTPPTGWSGAVRAPAYPLSYNGAGEGMAPAPPFDPPAHRAPLEVALGAPHPFPVSVRRDA